MLTVLVLYACITSFLMRLRWHGKVTTPHNVGLVKAIGMTWVRTVVPLTLMGIWWVIYQNGDLHDPLGPGMKEWVIEKFRPDHVWTMDWSWLWWNLGGYFLLALPKEATYNSALEPSVYEGTNDSVIKINMTYSLIWNVIFYAVVFLNPSLPFGYSLTQALRGNL